MSACDEEPCKSLIDEYWAQTIAASEAEIVLRLHCDVWKAAPPVHHGLEVQLADGLASREWR